jgi:DNA repair exonuclease SbcCD nuclease subunit
VKKLLELKAADIPTFMVLGNHDAENRFVSQLRLADVANVFASKKAETFELEELGVSIHGRSFPKRDVTENLAETYPRPVSGCFNIGVLHTACVGREDNHAPYAPCSVEQLVNHGYDYWALGHVHNWAVLNETPRIVYPGNLQGRNPRETGSKGAALVEVTAGVVSDVAHVSCDAVRWARLEVEVGLADVSADIVSRIREIVQEAAEEAGDRPMAIRLSVVGVTSAHDALKVDRRNIVEDVEATLATLANDCWLERLELNTTRPKLAASTDATLAGMLSETMERLTREPEFEVALEKRLQEIADKIPASAHGPELLDRLRTELPSRVLDLAKSHLLDGETA